MGPEGRPIPALVRAIESATRCPAGHRYRRLFCNPGNGSMVSYLGGQCGVGLTRFSALRGDARNVLGSPVGGGLPTKALPTGVSAVCPRLVRRSAHVG